MDAKEKRKRNLENRDIDMLMFTKTYHKDYPWLKHAIRSVINLNLKGFKWVIVGDRGSRAEIQKVIDQSIQECPHGIVRPDFFRVVEAPEYWPECNDIHNGYFSQQWIKMTAHRVMGNEYFLNWDSDVIAVKHINFDTFKGKSGRPIYWFSQFNHLISSGDRNVHIERMNVMKEVMAVNEVSFEYMRCMPVIMHGEILRVGSERAEWSRAFNAIKNGRGGFSEFNIIGMFSHLYFPDCYEWRNAEQQGPTWAGGFFESGIQAHAYVCQSWSWGGLTKDVENFVNAL